MTRGKNKREKKEKNEARNAGQEATKRTGPDKSSNKGPAFLRSEVLLLHSDSFRLFRFGEAEAPFRLISWFISVLFVLFFLCFARRHCASARVLDRTIPWAAPSLTKNISNSNSTRNLASLFFFFSFCQTRLQIRSFLHPVSWSSPLELNKKEKERCR